MKKIKTGVVILIAAALYPASLHAQFLHNVLNSVKQTTQNKASNKANDATNKVLDKILDSTFQSKSKTANSSAASIDTNGVSRVLGAFSKAATDNPNDTSSADLTMKALALLTGGGGISASDSATVIKSYLTGSGGSGMFYQYLTTATSKQKNTTSDTTSRYITNSGNGRSEMRINMPGVMSNKMITIGHANQPQYSIMLYPDSKTYSLNIIDTSLINSGGIRTKYEITKIGNEKVQGYQCIHSKIISTSGKGLFKSTSTMDIWTSNDVPGYSVIKKMMSMQNVQPGMMQALEKAGCGGMFVKMNAGGKDYTMTMLLTTAVEKSFPASMFQIPAGYKESKQNMMYHMMQGAK